MNTKSPVTQCRQALANCLAATFYVLWFISFAAPLVHAQSENGQVRPYPDPGYRRLGIYGGGLYSYFDYRMVKLNLEETFPNKSGFWLQLHDRSQAHPEEVKHDIYLLYLGEREGISTEDGVARVDAWLRREETVQTFPHHIPAVCLGEENTPSHREVLDGVAKHIRSTYGIPVFQWYSDPLPPDPTLTADGWIWDSYDRPLPQFRKHVMKFVALGKPAICVVWAADPHWTGWPPFTDSSALIAKEWHQFSTCMEFNVSTAAFAVAGAGSVSSWVNSPSEDMQVLREALRVKRLQMRDVPDDLLPLPTANYSYADRSIPTGGDQESPSEYIEDFRGFQWIHDATIVGFLNLRLDGINRLLCFKPTTAPASASLTYRFQSYFPLKTVRIRLDASVPVNSQARNELAITTDPTLKTWAKVSHQDDGSQDALETVHEFPSGTRTFHVRVTMSDNGSSKDWDGHALRQLHVSSLAETPPPGAAATLREDLYGNLSYEDDFSTPRWKQFGDLNVSHDSHGGYRDNGLWVGMIGGTAASVTLTQRLDLPAELKNLTITADCYADAKNLGGQVRLQVKPRGAATMWETATEGRHQGPLQLVIPEEGLAGARQFEIRLTLRSTSGVEQGEKACARVNALSIHAVSQSP